MKGIISISSFMLVAIYGCSPAIFAQDARGTIPLAKEVVRINNTSNEYSFELQTGSADSIGIYAYRKEFSMVTWEQDKIKISFRAVNESKDSLGLAHHELLRYFGCRIQQRENRLNIEWKLETGQPYISKVVVYVPAGNRVLFNLSFSTARLLTDIKFLDAVISNSYIRGMSVNHFILDSKYSTCDFSELEEGKVKLASATLKIKKAKSLDLDLGYSIAIIGKCDYMRVKAVSGNCAIGYLSSADANMKFGFFRVDTLSRRLHLTAPNAEVSLKHITNSTDSIRIQGGYIRLQLYLENTKQFALHLKGDYMTVRSPFTLYKDGQDQGYITQPSYLETRNNSPGYAVKKGNMNREHTKIDLLCNQSTITLK